MSKVTLNRYEGSGMLVNKSKISLLSEVAVDTSSLIFGLFPETWYEFYFIIDGVRVDLLYTNKEDAEHERHKLV